MRGIAKRFPGVQALNNVDLVLQRGQTLGVAGENGSGKSTLAKILAGRYAPDLGSILVRGETVRWRSAAAALNAGVALIAQEVLVYPELTVTENLLFGSMPRRRLAGINWAAAHSVAQRLLDELELDVSPQAQLRNLALHQKHMISIGKVLARRPDVLILDEPTSSLSEQQVQTLFRLIARFRGEGTSVIYITHRLREYFEVCERIAVLRDGGLVAEGHVDNFTEQQLVRAMVGRELSGIFTRRGSSGTRDSEPVAVAVRALTTPRKLRDVNIEVRCGEILGVAGQAGSGRTSLAQALFGVLPYTGSIEVNGRSVNLRTPRDAIRAGIGYVPEDRKQSGLILGSSVHDNLVLPSRGHAARFGIRSAAAEDRIVRQAVERLDIRAPSTATPAFALSGGNQQKVVIGKWLARRPRVLVLDEPTRGVDVGAKNEIYGFIEELAALGVAVVVCSSELLELLRLSHRIVVMAAGRIVGELAGDGATEESITALAFAGLRESEDLVA